MVARLEIEAQPLGVGGRGRLILAFQPAFESFQDLEHPDPFCGGGRYQAEPGAGGVGRGAALRWPDKRGKSNCFV